MKTTEENVWILVTNPHHYVGKFKSKCFHSFTKSTTGAAPVCGAGDAAQVLEASPAGWRQPRKGFGGKKMPSQKNKFSSFDLGARGMNGKGFGEATFRERSTHFSFTLGTEQPPLYPLSPTPPHFSRGIIKGDFLGRSHSFPVDQPLEGNIAQIHHNIKKPHPTPPQKRLGGSKHPREMISIGGAWGRVEIFTFG